MFYRKKNKTHFTMWVMRCFKGLLNQTKFMGLATLPIQGWILASFMIFSSDPLYNRGFLQNLYHGCGDP